MKIMGNIVSKGKEGHGPETRFCNDDLDTVNKEII